MGRVGLRAQDHPQVSTTSYARPFVSPSATAQIPGASGAMIPQYLRSCVPPNALRFLFLICVSFEVLHCVTVDMQSLVSLLN